MVCSRPPPDPPVPGSIGATGVIAMIANQVSVGVPVVVVVAAARVDLHEAHTALDQAPGLGPFVVAGHLGDPLLGDHRGRLEGGHRLVDHRHDRRHVGLRVPGTQRHQRLPTLQPVVGFETLKAIVQ